MTSQDLLDRVAELLGFRVTERDNDAVLIHEKLAGASISSVRPATREELAMFLRIIGLVARLEDCATEGNSLRDGNNKLHARLSEASREIDALQVKLDSAARNFAAVEDNFQERMSAALREIEALNNERDSLIRQRDEASQESVTARLLNEELRAKLSQLEEINRTPKSKGSSNV